MQRSGTHMIRTCTAVSKWVSEKINKYLNKYRFSFLLAQQNLRIGNPSATSPSRPDQPDRTNGLRFLFSMFRTLSCLPGESASIICSTYLLLYLLFAPRQTTEKRLEVLLKRPGWLSKISPTGYLLQGQAKLLLFKVTHVCLQQFNVQKWTEPFIIKILGLIRVFLFFDQYLDEKSRPLSFSCEQQLNIYMYYGVCGYKWWSPRQIRQDTTTHHHQPGTYSYYILPWAGLEQKSKQINKAYTINHSFNQSMHTNR